MAASGYAWWYLDALSDDGRHGLTLIAFIGSVFSPYYASARRRAPHMQADPLNHCSLNVALYDLEKGGSLWAMTERGRWQVRRNPHMLQIGPSALTRSGNSLNICIDEVTAPWPSRIRGVIRVNTSAWVQQPIVLDAAGQHRWSVLAPCAQVEVMLDKPSLNWSGGGYLDTNNGDAPLESAFTRWDWSRARLKQGDTAVFYDIQRNDASSLSLAMRFDSQGLMQLTQAPDATAMPPTMWRLARAVRSDEGHAPRVVRKLEDGPFYSRSLMEARWFGEPIAVVHESLCLQRFKSRWVQTLLPFRMPRRWI